MHAINALKVVANLLANGIAFVIFIVDGQVVWRYLPGGHGRLRHRRIRFGQPGAARSAAGAARAGGVIGLSMAAWFFWQAVNSAVPEFSVDKRCQPRAFLIPNAGSEHAL